MLSKFHNIVLNVKTNIKKDFGNLQHDIADRKVYKYFRCHGCKSKLRVGRGKGKIFITCPRCGLRFSGKS